MVMVMMMHWTQNAVVIVDNVIIVVAIVVVVICPIIAASRWCLLLSRCSFEQYRCLIKEIRYRSTCITGFQRIAYVCVLLLLLWLHERLPIRAFIIF